MAEEHAVTEAERPPGARNSSSDPPGFAPFRLSPETPASGSYEGPTSWRRGWRLAALVVIGAIVAACGGEPAALIEDETALGDADYAYVIPLGAGEALRQLDDADAALARMPELVVDRHILGRRSQRQGEGADGQGDGAGSRPPDEAHSGGRAFRGRGCGGERDAGGSGQ